MARAKHDFQIKATIPSDTVILDYRPLDPYRSTPEQIVLAEEVHDSLTKAINNLQERQKEYISYRFGFEDYVEHSVEEAAGEFYIGETEAKRIEKKALKPIRKSL